MDRKTLHDWQMRFQLRTVPGVNEVNSWGGETRQYTVEVDPVDLRRYGLTIRDVFERLRDNNRNFGGGFIEHAAEQYTVRGSGAHAGSRRCRPNRAHRAWRNACAGSRCGARSTLARVPRQGAVLRDGKGETVSGMAIMLKGENGLRGHRAREGAPREPCGCRKESAIVPFYDQSDVINGTIRTVTRNLLEAGLLVIAVLLLFLGNVRARAASSLR